MRRAVLEMRPAECLPPLYSLFPSLKCHSVIRLTINVLTRNNLHVCTILLRWLVRVLEEQPRGETERSSGAGVAVTCHDHLTDGWGKAISQTARAAATRQAFAVQKPRSYFPPSTSRIFLRNAMGVKGF